jgi:polysaccharide biosynthesis transport protein
MFANTRPFGAQCLRLPCRAAMHGGLAVTIIDPGAVRSTALVAASEGAAPLYGALDGMEINPKQIFRAIRRHILIIVLIPAVAMLAGAIITARTPPEYQAVATLQIEDRASKVLSTDDTQPAAQAQDSDRFLQTQIGLLTSKALAGQVVDRLALAADDRALVRLGMPAAAAAGLKTTGARREALVATLRAGLSVTLPRNSRIAQVAFKGRDAELSALIANAYVRNFIIYNLERRFQDSSYARSFLSEQLGQSKERLEASERALVAYATRSRLVESAPAAGAAPADIRTSTSANLSDLTTTLSSAEAARIEAEQRWSLAQRTPLMSLPEVLQSSAIQDLVERRAVARAEFEQERERRKPDFPTMQQASAQIEELNAQISGIATSIRDSLQNRYIVAAQNESALRARIEQLKSNKLAEDDLSIEYNILRREVDTNRTMHDGLLQRYKEVSAAAGVTANNITPVDTAELPTIPVSPKLKMNLASAGLLGALIALMVVFIREKFTDRIHTVEDVPTKLGVRHLGVLPRVPSGSTWVRELEDPKSPLSESTASIRAFLDHLVRSPACTSVLVTSSGPGESRLAFANGLARSFAKTGKRVLLIDTDLRAPSLHGTLKLDNIAGLSTILSGEDSPTTAIQLEVRPNLDFLSAGAASHDPAGLLSGPQFHDMLRRFAGQYGVLVLHAPPVDEQLADALLVAGSTSATILMVDADASATEEVKTSILRLRAVGASVTGAVLSRLATTSLASYAAAHAPRRLRAIASRRGRMSTSLLNRLVPMARRRRSTGAQ